MVLDVLRGCRWLEQLDDSGKHSSRCARLLHLHLTDGRQVRIAVGELGVVEKRCVFASFMWIGHFVYDTSRPTAAVPWRLLSSPERSSALSLRRTAALLERLAPRGFLSPSCPPCDGREPGHAMLAASSSHQ